MTIKAHYGGLKNAFKVGWFTRSMVLASGTQTVTGIGFKPVAIFWMANHGSSGQHSWGFDDASAPRVLCDSHQLTADTYVYNQTISIYNQGGGGSYYVGKINSFDSDGFTVGWTKIGAPTRLLDISYIAFGGEFTVLTESSYGEANKFKIGSFTRDLSLASGNQAITGVGFTPSVCMFIGTVNGVAGIGTMGMDTDVDDECWYDGQARVGGNHMYRDLMTLKPFLNAADYYEGTINSMDSDGFTIAWTKGNSPTGTFTVTYLAFQ